MTARRLFRDALPVILWLGVIFFLSTDNGSAEHTNAFLDRWLRLCFGALGAHWSSARLDLLHYCVRKAAHVTEYLILAVLLMRTLLSAPRIVRAQRSAWLAWGFATFYAMTDEFHQRFISSRTPKVTDVMIDSCGALLGVLLVMALRSIGAKRRARELGAMLHGGAPEAV